MKKAKNRVIPGFGISMGVTVTLLSLVVLIPLASLAIFTAQLGWKDFFETITRGRVLSSFFVSFITALVASAINAVMGLILAWVLVRYDFPGKRIMDGMIELPFALPTAVAGIALTSLTADRVLGASPGTIFRRVILPELLPALLTGTGLAFGRCIGEYGSVVFIAGNKPYYTEIAPLMIMSELQEYDYASASAIALVMLAASFLILFLINFVQARNNRLLKGGNA